MPKDRSYNREVMPDDMVIDFLTGDTMMINGWLREEIRARYVEMLEELEQLRNENDKLRDIAQGKGDND